jgi:hypothetical protein
MKLVLSMEFSNENTMLSQKRQLGVPIKGSANDSEPSPVEQPSM